MNLNCCLLQFVSFSPKGPRMRNANTGKLLMQGSAYKVAHPVQMLAYIGSSCGHPLHAKLL